MVVRLAAAVFTVFAVSMTACAGLGADGRTPSATATSTVEGPAVPPTAAPATTVMSTVAKADTRASSTPTFPVETSPPILTSSDVSSELCDAGVDVFVALTALDMTDPADGPALRSVFSETVERIESAIVPATDTTDVFERLERSFAVLSPALEGVDFDMSRIDTGNATAFAVAADEWKIGFDDLEGLLDGPCRLVYGDFLSLDTEASLLARSAGTIEPETVPNSRDSESGEIIAVTRTDDAGVIAIDVPIGWDQVNGIGAPLQRRLTVTPPGVSVLNDFGIDGEQVFVLVYPGDAVAAQSAGDLSPGLVELLTENKGCEISDEVDFDTGRYRGLETVLECVGSPYTSHLLVGASPTGTVVFTLGLVRFRDEPEVRDLIMESLVVD